MPLLCDEQFRLGFDEIGELLVTVEPGVKIGLQLGKVAPEGAQMCPPSVVN